MTSSSSGGVGDGAGERADLVERRWRRRRARSGDTAPVGRLHARPRRTARPAGGSTRRCRSRAPAARTRPPPPRRCPPDEPPGHPGRCRGGCGWGRRPSSRSSCPWRTRRGWSCRRRRRRPRAAARRRWRRRAGASPRGSATSRWSARPRVHRLSLRATGTPASGPGVLAGGDPRGRSAAAASRASSAMTRLKAWISPSRGVDGGEVLARPRRPRCGHRARARPRRSPGRATSAAGRTALAALTAPPRGWAAPGTGRPRPPAPAPAPRRGRGRATSSSGAARSAAGTGGRSAARRRRRGPRRRAAWSSTAASWPVNVSSSSSVSSSRASRATWATSSRVICAMAGHCRGRARPPVSRRGRRPHARPPWSPALAPRPRRPATTPTTSRRSRRTR